MTGQVDPQNKILPELLELISSSELGEEEVLAFVYGLQNLTNEEQQVFYLMLKESPELIYPLYINYKAKILAKDKSREEFEKAIEEELRVLDLKLSEKESK